MVLVHLPEMDAPPSAPPESRLQTSGVAAAPASSPGIPPGPQRAGLPRATAVTHLFLWSGGAGLNRLLFKTVSTCLSSGRRAPEKPVQTLMALSLQGCARRGVRFQGVSSSLEMRHRGTHPRAWGRPRLRSAASSSCPLEPFWTWSLCDRANSRGLDSGPLCPSLSSSLPLHLLGSTGLSPKSKQHKQTVSFFFLRVRMMAFLGFRLFPAPPLQGKPDARSQGLPKTTPRLATFQGSLLESPATPGGSCRPPKTAAPPSEGTAVLVFLPPTS